MPASVIQFLIGNMVFALMLSVGLAAQSRELTHIVRHPPLYVRALLVMQVGVPLLALTLVSALHLPPIAIALVLLVAICPGTTTRTRVSVVERNLLLLASLLAPLSIPAWIAIFEVQYPYRFQISAAQVLVLEIKLALVPLFFGAAVRLAWPHVADAAVRYIDFVFQVGFSLAIASVLALGAPLHAAAVVAAVLLARRVGSLPIEYYAARLRK